MSQYSGFRIRDQMDDILEARGYYRKHVAHDGRSLYRAVADALYGTQQHMADKVRRWLEVHRAAAGGATGRAGLHADLKDLVDMLGVTIDLVEGTPSDISFIRFTPTGEGQQEEAEGAER